MDSVTALHTAARRYCQEEFTKWAATYSALQTAGESEVRYPDRLGWDYSEQAYKVFPRYRIAQAILDELEKLVPSSVESVERMGELLIMASEVPENRLKAQFQNPHALIALAAEAKDYCTRIRELMTLDLMETEPLPYRRVLSPEETDVLWERLKNRWGVGNGYWYPLKEGDVPPNVMVFHQEYFNPMGGVEILREAVDRRGITRVFQLHEFGPPEPDYEIEASTFEPVYGRSGEEYSTSEAGDWLVYASHESSITIAGDWLAAFFRGKWTDWSQRTYQGPYSTPDLRGTRKTR